MDDNYKKVSVIGKLEYIKNTLDALPRLYDYIEYYLKDDKDYIIDSPYLKNYKLDNKYSNTIVIFEKEEKIPIVKDNLVDRYSIDKDKIIPFNIWLAYLIKNDESVMIIPDNIQLDVCTLCQLNCVDCYMRENNYGTVGKGYTKFEDFKKFIDDNTFIKKIEISDNGEVFMNPDIDKIIEYATEKKIELNINNGTNFNNIKESTLKLLGNSSVHIINISIDGASNETYPLYRRNGNFDNVINNIKKLNKYRDNPDYPYVIWQYIIMEKNEDDIEKAIELAKELNMHIMFKKSWNPKDVPKNKEKVKKLTGIDYDAKETGSFSFCYQMIQTPQINYDGRLLGCCIMYKDDWKMNVFKDGLVNCLNSDKYRKAIVDLLLKHEHEDDPCKHCHLHKTGIILI